MPTGCSPVGCHEDKFSILNSPVLLMLPHPREERFPSTSTLSAGTAFKPEDQRLLNNFFYLVAWVSKKESPLFSLGTFPSEKKGAGAGFAAPAEGPVGLARFSPAAQRSLISTSPCRWMANQGHLLSNTWYSQQLPSPWCSRCLLVGYVFRLSRACFLSLWEWKLQR